MLLDQSTIKIEYDIVFTWELYYMYYFIIF